MNVAILTPEETVFNGQAKSIKVPGTGGEFEILNNHAPIYSSLEHGNVRILLEDGERMVYTINSGFVEVVNNQVSVLVQGLHTEEK